MNHEQGYLTMAVGSRKFLEMAVDLALSIRSFDMRPVALGTDESLAAAARSGFPGVFDFIEIISPKFTHHRALKFSAYEVSPFNETVYLDADCLAVADLSSLWDDASDRPITMTGEFLSRSQDKWHQGFSSLSIMERFDLQAYLKTNGGVMHFRRDGAAEWLDECHTCYNEIVIPHLWDGQRPTIGPGDEFAFAIVGGRRGFGIYPNPVPQYWAKELAHLDLGKPWKPIVHFVGPMPSKTLRGLMRDVRARRKARGLPTEDSIAMWKSEARRPGWVRRFKRWLYPKITRKAPGRRPETPAAGVH